jgi:hypothetical protein
LLAKSSAAGAEEEAEADSDAAADDTAADEDAAGALELAAGADEDAWGAAAGAQPNHMAATIASTRTMTKTLRCFILIPS